MTDIVIPGTGRRPNRVMFVGEAPGEQEARQGKCFVGKTGFEIKTYLSDHELLFQHYYRTNVKKSFAKGNPDPTPAEVEYWTPELEREVQEVSPEIIVTMGRFATRWFLGESTDMEVVHGIPHESGAFDSSREGRANGAIVVPVYHPAFGFHNNDKRQIITYDFDVACNVIKGRNKVKPVSDRHAGSEVYLDVTGAELADFIADATELGLDTEGTPADPWSIQVSPEDGTGFCLRYEQPDFEVGITALQTLADEGIIFYIHNEMYDREMCLVMGLDLFDASTFDSMVAAYLLRNEPQGLKALAYRWTGMRMASYSDTLGKPEIDKQLEYLMEVFGTDWPKPEAQLVIENDGSTRLYTPRAIGISAGKIVEDFIADKRNKDGEPVDFRKRWLGLDSVQREMVESELGSLPEATLADIPLDEATRYSARDADAALRTCKAISPALVSHGQWELFQTCMEVLPVWEEMQREGMPASRSHFEKLAADMDKQMHRLQARISHRYNGDRPFNPKSPKQVGEMMMRRGLVGAKRTKTGMSTGKKSIEHLKHKDPAIADILEWREHQHVKDSFCANILSRFPDSDTDIMPVRCNIKTTRTATRRIATSEPNLVAMPARNLGSQIRAGFMTHDDEVFGAWDLSQVEMRVMAHLARDKRLTQLIVEGRDIHSETAAEIFHIDIEDVHPVKHRYPAKQAGFGIINNISGPGLYDQLRMYGCKGWSAKKCDQLIEDWLGIYSGVAEYLHQCKRLIRRKGIIHDMWSMPRYLPGIHSHDKMLRFESERTASSHTIQGGAQGMIQNSMVWLKPRIRSLQLDGENVHWCLQVHDEIILKFNKHLWELLNDMVLEALTQHHGVKDITVPIDADGNMANTWKGLK